MVMLAALNTAPVLPKLTAATLPNVAVDPVMYAPVLPIVTACSCVAVSRPTPEMPPPDPDVTI